MRGREIEYLCELLGVADRTGMACVRRYAISRLHNLRPPLPPLRRILLCQRYPSLSDAWLYPAVVELLEQAGPLDLDEARQVGLEFFQKLTVMREILAPSRDEHGALTFTRAQLMDYVSHNLEGHPGHVSAVPIPVHRWITG